MSRIVPLVLSAAALLLSVIAVLCACLLPRGLPGHHLSHYDFSSPLAALRSQLAMDGANDDLARDELAKAQGEWSRLESLEEAATLGVDREVDFAGKRLLFIFFTQDGKRRQYVECYQRDTWSGLWLYAPLPLDEMMKGDRKLFGDVQAWRS